MYKLISDSNCSVKIYILLLIFRANVKYMSLQLNVCAMVVMMYGAR
jgi:hypothetical protein